MDQGLVQPDAADVNRDGKFEKMIIGVGKTKIGDDKSQCGGEDEDKTSRGFVIDEAYEG